MTALWQPAASLHAIKFRARLLRQLRNYFDAQHVIEVVTPAISKGATTDPQIESLVTSLANGLQTTPWYLHTSPEFAMKRLLCADSGDIYQICTVFRQGESGRHHNPEFQMLEWYRLGYNHFQLMQDMQNLLTDLWSNLDPGTGLPDFEWVSYREAIFRCTGCQLDSLGRAEILKVLQGRNIDCPLDSEDSLDIWLDLLMSTVICKSFARNAFTFLYDYPPNQAALARLYIDADGYSCAARFELYFGELELANGFHELTDAVEQHSRFASDEMQRSTLGLPATPYDRNLIAALRHGLPDCSGVALGIDRLLMLLLQVQHLDEVVAFPIERA